MFISKRVIQNTFYAFFSINACINLYPLRFARHPRKAMKRKRKKEKGKANKDKS